VQAVEAQELRWVTRAEIKLLKLLPADWPIVQQL
jgi:hypothetical protein